MNDFEQYTYILDFSKNSKQRFFIFGNEKLGTLVGILRILREGKIRSDETYREIACFEA